MPAKTPVLPRILKRVKVDSNFCWLWTKYVMPGGYATISRDGKKDYIHRIIYEELVGPIPRGHDIDHLCRVRHCCNPRHLEAVTRSENLTRGLRKTQTPRRTSITCRNGHTRTKENTYVRPSGRPECKECRRSTQHR